MRTAAALYMGSCRLCFYELCKKCYYSTLFLLRFQKKTYIWSLMIIVFVLGLCGGAACLWELLFNFNYITDYEIFY